MKTRILLAATIVAGALCAGYWWRERPTSLGEADLLLLGDIANDSGENNFDGTLREALRVALLQSPCLNLVSDEKIRSVMCEAQGSGMAHPDGSSVPIEEFAGKHVFPADHSPLASRIKRNGPSSTGDVASSSATSSGPA